MTYTARRPFHGLGNFSELGCFTEHGLKFTQVTVGFRDVPECRVLDPIHLDEPQTVHREDPTVRLNSISSAIDPTTSTVRIELRAPCGNLRNIIGQDVAYKMYFPLCV
ncbi:hypothetical protein ACWGQ5_47055 [Streptomyces sp. NPDC055722]